jgi:ABC-2 type transport system permease protein
VKKIWIVACREYRAIVGTKAFVMAITMMPVLMFGGIAVQKMLEGRVGPTERRILVAGGAELYDDLSRAAQARNEREIVDPATGKQIKPRFVLEAGPPGPLTEAARYEISERIRRRQLDAFIEIPAHAAKLPARVEAVKVVFHAENAAIAEERNWLQAALGDAIRVRRMRTAGLDPGLVARAGAPVVVEPFGLVERSQTGELSKPKQSGLQETLFVPFGVMMLMWVVIFLAAQPMMESVLEEKTLRIAEVLLGSVNTFQLMLGKLLGGVGGSLTVVAIYMTGAMGLAWHFDAFHMVPFRVVPWFFVYQVLAVMLFGSIFMAIGAAVTQMKEAQSMLLPIWLVLTFPLFIWIQVVREPLGPLATWASFFPPATPLMMVLRIGATGAVPWWQSVLGVLILLAATLACVLAAARIFRIGFLSQGKSPRMTELLRWALRG